MLAVTLSAFGPPEALMVTEMPDPVPGKGQALIEVHLASITFVETQVRAGRPPHPRMAPALPAIPGNGVGGIIASVGAGVDPALVGTRVVATTGGTGGYAELAVVPAGGLVPVPDELGLADAVALLADGRTALSLMRSAAPAAGEIVLVEAAGGGVGSLLIQLASGAGATVVAAARGQRKLELARDLGAQAALDYGEPDWTERVRAECGGADVAFDGVGGAIGQAAFALLRAGGRFVPFGLASGAWAAVDQDEAARREVTIVRGGSLTHEESLALTREALAEAAAGRLRPIVGQTFPLARAAEAHAAIEARATLGKTLLVTERGSVQRT